MPLDISLIHGLDELRQFRLIVKLDDGLGITLKACGITQLVHKLGHLYVGCAPFILYRSRVSAQTQTIYHSSMDKLFRLICQKENEHTTVALRGQVEYVRDTYDTFQRLTGISDYFSVSIPEEECFFKRKLGCTLRRSKSNGYCMW